MLHDTELHEQTPQGEELPPHDDNMLHVNEVEGSTEQDNNTPPLPPKPHKIGRYERARHPTPSKHTGIYNNTHHDDKTDLALLTLPEKTYKNDNKTKADTFELKIPVQTEDNDDDAHYRDTDLETNAEQKKSCNTCSKLFLSSRTEYRGIKVCFAILVSVVLGVAMYKVFVHGYQYSQIVAGSIAGAATAIMSLCFAFSIKARCTGALIVPGLCTAQGRTAILSLIAGLILMGPMMNITKNFEHVAYSIGCGAEVASNLSREIRVLHSEPLAMFVDKLHPIVERLQRQEARLQQDLVNVTRFFESLQQQTDYSQICRQKMKSVSTLCDSEIDDAQSQCERRAAGNTGTITQKCDFLSVKQACRARLDDVCSGATPANGQQQHISNKLAIVREMIAMLHTGVNITGADAAADDAYEYNRTYSHINAYIHEKAQTARYILTIIQVIGKALSMSVMLLIVHSFVYLRRFLTKDTFDNCYITSGMKRLDADNRNRRKTGVLPLRKAERRTYVDSTTPRLSPLEKELFKHGLVTLLLHMVAGGIVCVFDYFLYRVLDLIDNQITMDTGLDGAAHSVNVSGSGLLAQIIRLFIQSINDSYKSHDLEYCTNPPNKPSFGMYYVIAAAYGAAFILVFIQAYAMRLRRKVVAYYYPERETERNTYLINRILRKRQNFTNRLTRNIQRTVHEMKRERKERISVLVLAKRVVVAVFCWTVKRPAHCLVCDEVDRGEFYHCLTEKCHGVYCRECLRDVRNICQLCFVHETV